MGSGTEGGTAGVSGLTGLYLWVLPRDWKAELKDLSPAFAAVLRDGSGWDVATNVFGWTYRLTIGAAP